MNDVNNRIFREFTMFLGDVGKKSPELSVSLAYEITIKSYDLHRPYDLGFRGWIEGTLLEPFAGTGQYSGFSLSAVAQLRSFAG